jgi:tetratricopeptide (TPR) repeat protein
MFRVGSFVLFLAALACVEPALAQEELGTTADDEEARALYEAGERAFGAGNFERALEHFRRAYELSHRGALLYNIGLTADRLRRDAEALEAFEAFLATGPEASLRASVEARVAVLRGLVRAETPTPAPAGPDLAGPIALLVAGGLVLAGGGVMLGVAASEDSIVQNAAEGSPWSDVAGHHETAEALAIGGSVALGVGALTAVGGAVWLATSGSSEPVAVSVGPGGIAVRGSF